MTDHLRTWTPIPLATSRYECPCGATGRCNMSGVIVAQKTDRPVNWEGTIASKPYDGAHFATMPPEIAQRCILAGSRTGDEVLDPFLGSGTTGEVAEANGRRWFGVELQPNYAPLIEARTAQRGLFFGGAA